MSNLKTTKEERARLREEAPCIVVEFGTNNDGYTGTSPRNEEVTSILDDLDTLEEALEERDNDLHMRIRAGYDRCIADTWRAEVAKVKLRTATLEAEVERLRGPRHIDEWHDDDGPALWWKFPICEPPYVGSPLNDDFPDYVTHWTPCPIPKEPTP